MMKSLYFTEEHDLFRESLATFLAQAVAPHLVAWEAAGKIDRQIFRQMGEMGFLGLDNTEEEGGMGTDFFYNTIFLEELGKVGDAGFLTSMLTHVYLAMNYLKQAGSAFIKAKYLQPSIAGEKVGALAMTEAFAGSDLAKIRTTARREGDHYIVNGSKTFITNAHYGDYMVTAVRADAGISLLVIDNAADGVSTNKLDKIGIRCSDTAEVAFDEVKVPVENLLGEEGKGFYYMMESLQTERLAISMGNIGLMDYALKITLKYMEERQAFGQSLNKFQALRHRLVDLASEVEAYRQYTHHTCWLYEQGEVIVKECSMLKLKTSEILKKLVDECLQMFGGYGYMDEYPISKMYRDVRVIPIYAGTSEIMREILSRIIFDGKEYKKVYKENKV